MNRSNVVRIVPAAGSMEVREYATVHIRDDVPFVDLNRALLEQGLSLRVDSAIGLVIEPADLHPTLTLRGPG